MLAREMATRVRWSDRVFVACASGMMAASDLETSLKEMLLAGHGHGHHTGPVTSKPLLAPQSTCQLSLYTRVYTTTLNAHFC